MLKSVRSLMAATVLTSAGLFATPALANAGDAGLEISGNAAIVSEYRFRGIDLSGGDFAVQGGIDVGHSSGFYVGTWGSSLTSGSYGATELDVYAGWAGDLGGVSVDVGGIYYLYPNAVPGAYDYYELLASVGTSVGPADFTVGVGYAPSQNSLDFGGPDDNLYVYTDVGIGIPETPVSLTGHLGYTDGALTFTPDAKAFDYSVGASLALGEKLSVGAAYTDAEGVGDGVVFTLGASF